MFTVKTLDGRVVSIVALQVEALIVQPDYPQFTTIVMVSGAEYKVELGSRDVAAQMVGVMN